MTPAEYWPTISIAVPTLNQGHFLAQTLDSLLEQNYPELEVVIQDGGSTDMTSDVLARYRERVADVVSERDSGQADALNRAFARSRGEIMGWLNSDDLLLPGALCRVGAYFARHPEVDVVYGWRVVIDDKGRCVGRWAVPASTHEYLPWADYVPQETVFWRRSAWERVGGCLNPRLQFALDWDLLLRFQRTGALFACIPEYVGAFRVHSASKTAANLDSVGSEDMRVLRLQHHGRHLGHREITRKLLPLYSRAWAVRLRGRVPRARSPRERALGGTGVGRHDEPGQPDRSHNSSESGRCAE